ncbi:RDD family protein [Streptomyces sp. ADI93-02]|nr:RDD family protein [Streptomyces sp. ADI93-02]
MFGAPPGGVQTWAQYRGRVDNRQAIGSWLSGPRAAAEEMGADFGYRGERLGLPQEGPGSVAPLGRRFGALFIDWAACMLIAYGLIARGDQQAAGNWALGVFLVLSLLTVGTVGSTPGKRIMGLRVVAEDGGRLGTVRVVLRTVLLLLVIPAIVWDRDSRGLHDRLARAVQVRI